MNYGSENDVYYKKVRVRCKVTYRNSHYEQFCESQRDYVVWTKRISI